jgi:hypothetical protein
VSAIEIDLEDPETVALWAALGDLVPRLPAGWVLIGGLMVQLHAIEHDVSDVRTTVDIDVLGQARPPGALEAIHAALESADFELVGLDLYGYAHRYERDGLIVDLLAPDGIRPSASLAPGIVAVSTPGGSQALSRAETVTISVRGRAFELRRPTLLGAILIKARSLMVHSDPETQREDLLQLLALVEDPRATAVGIRKTERRWLRKAGDRLNPGGLSALDPASAQRAQQAYELLIAESRS